MIIRVEKNRDFSIVSNAILRDKRLTIKARFILVFCLSLSNTWEFNIPGLATIIGTGIDTIKSGLKELEQYGYLTRKQTRINGRLSTMEYILNEAPSVELPSADFPPAVLPPAENPPQYNTNLTNTNQTNTNISSVSEKPKAKKERKTFVPPTLEEVIAYAKERNSTVNPKFFYDYYSSADWVDGKGVKVKNWKQRFVTWDNKERRKPRIECSVPTINFRDYETPEDNGGKSFMDMLLEEEKNG